MMGLLATDSYIEKLRFLLRVCVFVDFVREDGVVWGAGVAGLWGGSKWEWD